MNRKKPRSKNQAQALVEFVLALPVLLLLLFGIIEFGRLVQTWLAVQNAARFGMRYAVTGEYIKDYCQVAATTLGYSDADLFDATEYDCRVPQEYCESLPPGQQDNCDHQQMSSELQDWARLPSIARTARAGGAGTSVNDEEAVSGNYLAYLISHNFSDLGSPSTRGYFHVTICSGRDDDSNLEPDFRLIETTAPYTCEINRLPYTLMDDAGGPGDRVRVTVRYVHPMIMPLISSIWPEVPLIAWREGIVEQFRVSRISGLGGAIGLAPSPTPSPTITPTHTNTPTEPPPPTNTNTPTPTDTPTPACGSLQINGSLQFAGDDLQLSLSNTDANWPVSISQAHMTWAELEDQADGPWHDEVTGLPGNQYFDSYLWEGSTVLDVSPNISLGSPTADWSHNLDLVIDPLATGDLALDFNLSFATYIYYHMRDFELTLDYTVGGITCPPLSVTGSYGPIVSINPALPNPIPWNGFTVRASASDPDGTISLVEFEIWNSAETQILGAYDDPSLPYCLFGDYAGVCILGRLGNVWPGSSNPILNGDYVVYVEAQDNDAPSQFTRIRQPFRLSLQPPPPTSTPRPATATSASPPTAVNTPKPPNTATATLYTPPQSTATATGTDVIPSPTATRTQPSIPSVTPTRTVTPTPCMTPPDLGGCR